MARAIAAAVFLAAAAHAILTALPRQAPLDARELAEYRLTTPVFERFTAASTRIAAATRQEPGLAVDPLFTREVLVSGEAAAAAAALEKRLQAHPALSRALGESKITAREYTTFALALVAARLAHGFVQTGVLRRVPEGAATENVAFVARHEQAVSSVLAELGIDD